MSWNQFCYISLCNTLTKTFRLKLLALFPQRPKRDQNETCTISFKLKGLALFLIRKLPICRNVRTGTSFLYLLDWKSKHFNWNVTEWKFTQSSLIFKSFQEEIVKMRAAENSIQILIILWLNVTDMFSASQLTTYSN